jgi:flagellar hook protein FlgE
MRLNSVHSIALSGMQSASRRLEAASHNVANWGTDRYQRPEAASAVPLAGGLASRASPAGASDGGLAEDVVAQRVALYEFKSAMQVFKTQQDMLGTLLDLRA